MWSGSTWTPSVISSPGSSFSAPEFPARRYHALDPDAAPAQRPYRFFQAGDGGDRRMLPSLRPTRRCQRWEKASSCYSPPKDCFVTHFDRESEPSCEEISSSECP